MNDLEPHVSGWQRKLLDLILTAVAAIGKTPVPPADASSVSLDALFHIAKKLGIGIRYDGSKEDRDAAARQCVDNCPWRETTDPDGANPSTKVLTNQE